jgi:hypothetical protein
MKTPPISDEAPQLRSKNIKEPSNILLETLVPDDSEIFEFLATATTTIQ